MPPLQRNVPPVPKHELRIVITGVSGFVGGALARALVGEGRQVVGLVRPSSNTSHLSELDIVLVEGDVTDPQSLAALFQPGDWVIHAAGMLGQSGVPESSYHKLHVEGTRNVLTAVEKAGVGRVLYVSSPGVLGPIDGPAADESMAVAPSNPYERSKAAAEKAAQEFAAQGMTIVIARPEFIYGPGDAHVLGLFQAVQRGIFFYIGRGQAVCHPTFIDDAVRGMILCLEKGRPGQIYHITGPRPVTFEEYGRTVADALEVRRPWLRLPKFAGLIGAVMLEFLGKVLGFNPPLSRTGVDFFSENRRFSWQKANRELGYQPEVDLAEGVKRTVDYYRQQNLLS
jgi:nucleoside-diphosphate-sugar epimerase